MVTRQQIVHQFYLLKKSFPINRNKLLFSRVNTDNLHEIKNSSKNKKNV
jgi:hypothetical protein